MLASLGIHSFTIGTFLWHAVFDGISDAGGYWASKFCKHWYHRVPIAVAFGLVTTFCLVTFVG